MTPRHKSSLLWGLVGALSFLVLVQGYRLLVGPLEIGLFVVGGGAVAVGALSAGLTHLLAPRIRENGRT
ncbi:hypothetical protein [Haloplanus halobius]|uniref:hypothetical protein n=1 Tax=Haloplanus halobius TaxID=2934938 RepID=UPI00200D36CA|nr:hypothetical protein [Haloplanus sp. XH21]